MLVNITQPKQYDIPDSDASEQIHKIWIKKKEKLLYIYIIFLGWIEPSHMGWVRSSQPSLVTSPSQ